MGYRFSEDVEKWFADTIARCFEYSTTKNIDSYQFARDFLNSEDGQIILTDKFVKPYNSFAYMFNILNKELHFAEGETYSPDIMWMYGYLVKYWVYHKNMLPKDIWNILPVDMFRELYPFYHTQGWNYIIEDAIKRYEEKT